MGCPDHITSRAKVVSEKLIKRVTKRVAEKRIAIRRVRKRQRLLNSNRLETKQIPMLVGTNVKPWLQP